jgi:outer membrane biosynthesis protein TonB
MRLIILLIIVLVVLVLVIINLIFKLRDLKADAALGLSEDEPDESAGTVDTGMIENLTLPAEQAAERKEPEKKQPEKKQKHQMEETAAGKQEPEKKAAAKKKAKEKKAKKNTEEDFEILDLNDL